MPGIKTKSKALPLPLTLMPPEKRRKLLERQSPRAACRSGPTREEPIVPDSSKYHLYQPSAAAEKPRTAKADEGECKESCAESDAKRALSIYHELFRKFRRLNNLKGGDFARAHAEKWVTERYEELDEATSALLKWTGHQKVSGEVAAGQNYEALEFRGMQVDEKEEGLSERLELHRRKGAMGLTRDALVAVLSLLCSRVEKTWMLDYDDEVPVRGYFAHALVDVHARIRISMIPTPGRTPRLASLLVTKEKPLHRALGNMDSDGPIPNSDVDDYRKMCPAGRQFGLQTLDVTEGGGYTLARAPDVRAEPAIRELFVKQKDVILLDVYAALAPRHLCRHRENGLGDVVKGELISLLSRAKERGQGVVFHVGSHDPIKLATKVYLRPEFTKFGLRCGYLRYRNGPTEPWGRQKQVADRVLVGLQLP